MPELSRIDPATAALLLIFVVAFVVAAVVVSRSTLASRSREGASLSAIGFVRTSFVSRLARGEPLDELLPDVVEALRGSMHLDAAEIWLMTARGDLQLSVSDPARDPAAIALRPD